MQPQSSSHLLRRQWAALWPILLGVYMPAFAFLVLMGVQREIPIQDLTRDAVSVTGVSVLVGLLSEVGKLMWMAAATVCLLTALALRTDAARRWWLVFFAVFGVLTLVLLADDVLLIHSRILANRVRNPYAGKMLVGAYVLIVGAAVVFFRRQIARTDFVFLALAVSFFGLSLLVDQPGNRHSRILIEDGSMLLGILSWLIYFTRAALKVLRESVIVVRDAAP
jgi:hypothetical protein